MNKLLLIDLIYDVFKFGIDNNINPTSYFKDLFKNEEFIKLLNIEQHNFNDIKRLVLVHKKTNTLPSLNEVRYLAFLIASFIDIAIVPVNKLTKYINPKDIFDNFDYYHTKDEREVIFELMIEYNSKYLIRGLKFYLEDDLFLVKENLLKIFPFKRFEEFELIYQNNYSKITVFYSKKDEVLFYYSDIKELLSDDYFKNKYIVGNGVYCFSREPINLLPKDYVSTIYYFQIKDKEILFTDPSGNQVAFKTDALMYE